jgi:hypothetical protein
MDETPTLLDHQGIVTMELQLLRSKHFHDFIILLHINILLKLHNNMTYFCLY